MWNQAKVSHLGTLQILAKELMDKANETLRVPRKKKKKLNVISCSHHLFVGEDSQGATDWNE